MNMKKCTKCGIEYELSQFNRHGLSKDGYTSVCRNCTKKKKKSTKVEANPALADFSPRELLNELKSRGYNGTLYYTPPQKVVKIEL